MQGILASYVRQSEAAGRDVDLDLLAPVIAIFDQLDSGEEPT
jgi:hypothetical protein